MLPKIVSRFSPHCIKVQLDFWPSILNFIIVKLYFRPQLDDGLYQKKKMGPFLGPKVIGIEVVWMWCGQSAIKEHKNYLILSWQ